MIPLYEDEARKAVNELLDRGVKAVVIAFLCSFANPQNELAAGQIAREIIAQRGIEVPVFLAHKIHPVFGEAGRLNSVIIQVYAAEPSREQLGSLKREFGSLGSKASIYVLTNYGTMVPPDYERLVHTIKSGPTGGVLGTKFLAEQYDLPYAMSTDVGGTSFDVGAILSRQPVLRDQGIIGQYWVNLPMVAVDSIGAGTGSFVRVDRITGRLRIGPDSAGYRIGVCWPEGGIETVTVNDANLVLGYLNPYYFLGGQVKLDPERAYRAIEEQIARPLGTDVYTAAWGIHNMVNLHMRLYLQNTLLGMGFAPELFHVVCFGGGGPLHAIGYTHGLNFAGVLIPSWAAGFSAFGAACGDLGVRHELSVNMYIPPPKGAKPGPIALGIMQGVYETLPDEVRARVDERIHAGTSFEEAMSEVLREAAAMQLSSAWQRLTEEIRKEMARAGLDASRLRFNLAARMLYAGMLDDLEVSADHDGTPESVLDTLVAKFEDTFERIYARASKSSEFGYNVTRAVITGVYPAIKPSLQDVDVRAWAGEVAKRRSTRKIYYADGWHEADIYEMDALSPGTVVEGPSVIEAPATTLFVPPQYRVYLDRHRVFWAVRPGEDINKYKGR